MSVEDLMMSYESVTKIENVSHQRMYFTDGARVVKREFANVDFVAKLFASTKPASHDWTLVPNLASTKIVPFLPHDDYVQVNKLHPQVFRFTTLGNKNMCTPTRVGNYMVWPKMSACFLGWALYLYINTKYEIRPRIPLCHHRELGKFNLLTNEDINLDVSCKITRGDSLMFTNTDSSPDVVVFTAEEGHEVTNVKFGKQYVFASNNKLWFDYLVNDTSIVKCLFKPEYSFICDVIDLNVLRWDGEAITTTPNFDEEPVQNSCGVVSPCSNFEREFSETIVECLKVISDAMMEQAPTTLTSDDILNFYLKHSGYSTFYVLIIAVWQYCEYTIKMHNQYTIEDILYFLKTLCIQVGGGDDLLIDNLIYFSTKNTAKNFMNSLQFFVTPDRGTEDFFRSISAYYTLHLSIYKKTESWVITSTSVREAEVDNSVKSVGFYKKIKVGKYDYIFNGGIYEHYKNRKDHSIASMFETCPEVTVSELLFNKTLNFYMTQEGLFDVCKKIYRESCPFVVMSTLKKNYVANNQTYLEQNTFRKLYNSIADDLTLFKVYHARKFVQDYESVDLALRECAMVDSELIEPTSRQLETKWRDLMNYLLECRDSDVVLIALRIEDRLQQPINNVISLALNVDLIGIRVALACHFLWPNSKCEIFFWALLSQSYHDFEDWMEGYEWNGICTAAVFDNKKKITEGMARLLGRLDYGCKDIMVNVMNVISEAGVPDNKKYDVKRVIKNVGALYKKYKNVIRRYGVFSDLLLSHRKGESMYSWLTRFYMRMFLHDFVGDVNELKSVVRGFSYFRVFTNFHVNNSKVLINFCASLAIPVDNEKMCIVLSSKPNCGKSSLWELLSGLILVYKQDKEHYKHNKNEKDEKVKLYESQLYVMNEAQQFTKAFLKSVVDSTKIDSARCNYGIMEKFNDTSKCLICNNEDDKIFVTDGYDKACSNRIGQMYFDHEFDPTLNGFCGSVYEHYVKKRYAEERDIVVKLKSSVQAFLANVLMHNSDPNDGHLYYKSILQNDVSYKHNKKCLYIYNCRIEALLYVMDVRENKNATEFSEEQLIDLIKCSEKYVVQMLHPKKRASVSVDSLCSDFKRKYNTSARFYNADTKMYSNLHIITNEKHFRQYPPRFRANVDDVV
ncbi:helicase [Clostera anachoreta granulovirus]|uniref:Helicase n=1 Tax=Clostera anachoreta granulovirus TaxID=283675 RepID=F4ZKV2_9BBAC|nr:helicase [Clostera anachoreta granulovirus]AEB00363.1 helicase [Clostera anachoreta granulovirus]